jgi:hypothetical protein
LRTTKQVARLLGVDPACFTVWRYRGLGPCCESKFFRGAEIVYRLDRGQAWLAARRGLDYDQDQAWTEGLRGIYFEPEGPVREYVQRLVRLFGPKEAAPAGGRWLANGFEHYLDSLLI